VLQWVFYVLVVSAAVSVAGVLAEQALRRRHLASRWAWLASLAVTVLLSFQAPPVSLFATRSSAPGMRATAQTLRPVVPIHLPDVSAAALKSADAEDLFRLDSSVRTIWFLLSALMLTGLSAGALQVYLRRRRWPMRLVESHCVGISEDVGPAVIGLIRPTIVLPQWVLGRPHSEQRLILAHEASHLRARDPLSLTVGVFAVLLLPWNPLLWWQLHRLRHAIEVDCDARVLGAGHDVATYGEALIEVGQHRSRYLGTVFAMSEKRTLLEKRIEIMTQRARKPWSLGFAALSALSLSVALAATQVTEPATTGDTELTLEAATLDRYVGHYRIGPSSVLTIARDGAQLNARISGQPTFPIYADTPTDFHWKVVEARVTFSGDADGLAAMATLHQNGMDIAAPRLDDAAAAQVERRLADRVAAHQPQPGTEAALRKTIAAMIGGAPNYADMSDRLQDVVRKQKPAMDAFLPKLGAIQTVEFRGVADAGLDKYVVTHEGGKQSQWLIQLGGDGRISALAVMPVF
jgi:beta-lactamase regulating signal transducer with metallopeptidase domain